MSANPTPSVEVIRETAHRPRGDMLVPDNLQKLVDLTYAAAEALAIKSGAPTGDRLDLSVFLTAGSTLAAKLLDAPEEA